MAYPNTDPSFFTNDITISGISDTEYTIDIPSQGANTYSSFLMYIITRDEEVMIKNVQIHIN